VELAWIAAARYSCASPGVTNEADRSGLRVGPEPINTVPKEGLEPSRPKAQEPKSCVSTSSTTPAPPSCQNLNTTYGAQILTSRRRSLQM
jgi:hypothetical protein